MSAALVPFSHMKKDLPPNTFLFPPALPKVDVPEYVREERPVDRLFRLLQQYDFGSDTQDARNLIMTLSPDLRHLLNLLLTTLYNEEMFGEENTTVGLYELREQISPLTEHKPELKPFVERIFQKLFDRLDERILLQK